MSANASSSSPVRFTIERTPSRPTLGDFLVALQREYGPIKFFPEPYSDVALSRSAEVLRAGRSHPATRTLAPPA